MGPIRVTVRRGSVVEAVHVAHAVAVEGGRIVDSAGDPELLTFYRSSSKPLQALPLARERDDVEDRDRNRVVACLICKTPIKVGAGPTPPTGIPTPPPVRRP